jgi:hypothetical protein
MPIITTTAGSEGWWFAKLLKQLGERQDRLNLLDAYYRGEAPLPEGAQSCKQAYREFQKKSRTNFASLVVEAVRERMIPTGFRTGATDDDLGDDEAWRIWQANQLDADAALVHRAALSMGDAYVIVGGVDPATEAPLITGEDPRQVITAHDPRNRRKIIAALKVFCDYDLGFDFAYLYLPGRVLVAGRRASESGMLSYDAGGWDWAPDLFGTLPALVVPVVRFSNRADLAGHSMGEFEDVTDVLDRINFMLLQRLVIAAVQAFKQRAIKGDLPTIDANGDEIDYNGMFRADAGALWHLPEGTDIWESTQADLGGILSSVRHDIQDLAAVTRTPLFYLTPESNQGSAEGGSLAREGLVFKTEDRMAQSGESWEQVMSLAFLFAGDQERAARGDMEVVWASPERFSLAERYSSAVQAQAAGVPWRSVMTDVLQFSPQKVARMEAERATDVLLTGPEPEPVAPFEEEAEAVAV